jgi:hypothetical protein
LITKNDLLNEANNGDLLFFAGDTYGEKTIRWYTRSYFNHVAIVFRDIDWDASPPTLIAFIAEADLGQGYKEGVRVMRLADKLKRWKGEKIGGFKRLMSVNRPSTNDILLTIEKYLAYGMDRSMMCWLFSSYPQSIFYKYFKPEKSFFCSEFVATILCKLGIQKTKNADAFTPEDFFSDSIELEKEYTYGVSSLFIF